MATLNITEITSVTLTSNAQVVPVLNTVSAVSQNVAIGASSTASAAFGPQTVIVRLFTDTACGLAFGTDPTAGAISIKMAANSWEYWGVPAGQNYKVAVITP